jgi:protein TonB
MQTHDELRQTTPSGPRMKRRTIVAFAAFVALSAGVHFTLGPELTKMSPHWAVSDLPDQALSIITLSHKEQPQAMPSPTPTPTPPPVPLIRTKRDLSFLKYREIGSDVRMRKDVRPPARRKSTIVLDRAAPLHPNDKARDADVVAAAPQATPQTQQNSGASRTDTSANRDELAGSVVWGDDNPPRLLRPVKLGVDDHATGTARVEVQVGTDGEVVSVQLVQSSGDATVDQAALDAARSATFAPATLNGMPVHGQCTLEFGPSTQTT